MITEPLVLQPSAAAWEATRAEGERRIAAFVPRANRAYADQRNFDRGPDRRENVSVLSPYVRHRLVSEDEVVRAVAARFTLSAAEKFVQEVLWRTYWKGRLERQSAVWADYLELVVDETAHLARDRDLAERVANAEAGRTGNAAFDAWARELAETGYLHNHARMWFASMWIFTFGLPWVLGADFFIRHLMDGDPASNTLSWRWVAGLQTKGKTYAFSRDNVLRYTEGRLDPGHTLARDPKTLEEAPYRTQQAPPLTTSIDAREPAVLVVHDDDASPEAFLPDALRVRAVVGFAGVAGRSPGIVGAAVRTFARGAVADAVRRNAPSGVPAHLVDADDAAAVATAVVAAARAADVRRVVVPYAPIGPTRTLLDDVVVHARGAGLTIDVVARVWDDAAWRYSGGGYFSFKEKIPQVLASVGIVAKKR
jgi:deoxyribodipyrimidine photo-lyase